MSEPREFSLGRHTGLVLGAATLMFAATTLVLWLLQPSGPVGLLVVAVGLVATGVCASLVAKASVRRSFGEEPDGSEPSD
ncbi:hypothetical protein [Rhodococcus sp. MEB041]|uniref:hypothetical protein n=1 Tax=Rhodococcus sp. MEB041 TaxID=3040323 RepID=UPI00254BAA85|nr:hypothetical protein [Rhodococcus sp. MEB041]